MTDHPAVKIDITGVVNIFFIYTEIFENNSGCLD